MSLFNLDNSEQRLELIDRGRREIAQLLKEWDKGALSCTPHFIKHYLEGKLRLCLRLRHLIDGSDCQAILEAKVERTNGEFDVLCFAPTCSDGDHKHLVFVGDVSVMDDPERMTLIPSRLQIVNESFGAFDGALYLSSASGYVFVPIKVDRELTSGPSDGARVNTVLFDESPDQMIKAGPKMVDNFAHQQPDSLVSRMSSKLIDSQEIASLIIGGIVLGDDSVSVPDNFTLFPFEILDVLVGPLNLDPNTIEWMRHGA